MNLVVIIAKAFDRAYDYLGRNLREAGKNALRAGERFCYIKEAILESDTYKKESRRSQEERKKAEDEIHTRDALIEQALWDFEIERDARKYAGERLERALAEKKAAEIDARTIRNLAEQRATVINSLYEDFRKSVVYPFLVRENPDIPFIEQRDDGRITFASPAAEPYIIKGISDLEIFYMGRVPQRGFSQKASLVIFEKRSSGKKFIKGARNVHRTLRKACKEFFEEEERIKGGFNQSLIERGLEPLTS